MAYPEYLRLRARELRVQRRLTLDEIVERLVLPRTTVYEWIKDLPLGKPRWTAGQAKRVTAMQAKYQRLREEAYAQGAAEFETLALDPTFPGLRRPLPSLRAPSEIGTPSRSVTPTAR